MSSSQISLINLGTSSASAKAVAALQGRVKDHLNVTHEACASQCDCVDAFKTTLLYAYAYASWVHTNNLVHVLYLAHHTLTTY